MAISDHSNTLCGLLHYLLMFLVNTFPMIQFKLGLILFAQVFTYYLFLPELPKFSPTIHLIWCDMWCTVFEEITSNSDNGVTNSACLMSIHEYMATVSNKPYT